MGVRTATTAAAVVCALCVAAGATAIPVSTSPWVTKANAVCRVWNAKAVAAVGAHPKQPSTLRGMYEFLLKARPIELGQPRALERITLPRAAGATRALRLARIDLAELDAGIAAYRAGKRAAFVRDVRVWQSDRRASRAFTALGARACA